MKTRTRQIKLFIRLRSLFVILLVWLSLVGFTQETTAQLNFSLDYNGFFRNNEYFEDYLKGYTLTGNHVTPQIELSLGNKASIDAGAHLLKYNGLNTFTDVVPYLGIELQLSGFNVKIGSYSATDRMQFSDKLFSAEFLLTDYLEEGLLIKYQSKQLKIHTWLDWEQFIFSNDPFREQFKLGTGLKWNTDPEKESVFHIKIESLIQHKGGQIDLSDLPVSTVINHAMTLRYEHKMTSDKRLLVGGVYYDYRDLNENAPWHSKNGWAIDIPVSYSVKKLLFKAGYWHGRDFVAPYGNPVFQTTSLSHPGINMNNNSIAYIDLKYNYKLLKGLSCQAAVSNYYMIDYESLNYFYSIKAIFSEKFFLTNLKSTE